MVVVCVFVCLRGFFRSYIGGRLIFFLFGGRGRVGGYLVRIKFFF